MNKLLNMKNIKQKILTISFLLASFITFAQVGIGTETPQESSALDITSSDKGFLLPRMSTADRNNINPSVEAVGLQVFDTNTKSIWIFDGLQWLESRSKFVDGTNLNNAVYTDGNIGIGTVDPEGVLDIVSTNSGLVLPRVATTAAVTTPVNGMLVYDLSTNCLKAYENSAWTTCLSSGATTSAEALAQIGNEGDNPDTVSSVVSLAELGAITPPLAGLDAANETAYQDYIDANPDSFSSPATQAEVEAMVTSVNASQAVLAQIGNEADNPDTVNSVVTAAELGGITPPLAGLDAADETAYQDYIDANPDSFSSPATQAELEAMVNAVTLSPTVLTQIGNEADNPDTTSSIVTVAELGGITPPLAGLDAANETAYQDYIDANPDSFASPATQAEVEAMVTSVNASHAVLAQIGSEADNPDTVSSVVTAAELGAITPPLAGLDAADETAYQDYIDANPDSFSSPATQAELEAMVNAVTTSPTVLAQIGNEADNPDTTSSVVTVAELGAITPSLAGLDAANETAYQDYIDANPDSFSSPATLAEVEAMVTAVNAAQAVLAQIGSEADNPDTTSSVVTVAELGSITPSLAGLDAANETAYQDYIDANPDSFSSPATQAEVEAMVSAVNTSQATSVISNCDQNGFEGGFVGGVALDASNDFTVTITNNTFSTASFPLNSSDLVLSGAALGTVTVSSVSPSSVNIVAGQSQVVTYQLSGTPVVGELQADWTKISLSCTKTKTIGNGDATFTNPRNNGYVFSVDDTVLPLNYQGSLTIGSTVNIPYTSGLGSYPGYTSPFAPIDAQYAEDGASDWTFGYSYASGVFSTSGNIVATLVTQKGGINTDFEAKRVSSIDIINFDIVNLPLIVDGQTMSNTVGLDEGGDAIRGSLSVSGQAYDAAPLNSLVEVTETEYDNMIIIVPGSSYKGAQSRERFQGGLGWVGGVTAPSQTNHELDQNSYVVGVAYRTTGTYTSRHFNVLALHSSTAMSVNVAQQSICLSTTTVGIDFENKTHFFAVKRPQTNSGENTYLAVGAAVGGGVPYGGDYTSHYDNTIPPDEMRYSNIPDNYCGDLYKNNGPYEARAVGVQVIGSTQKSW